MSEAARYESVDTVRLAKLIDIEGRARRTFQNVLGFSPSEPQRAFFEHGASLPPLATSDGIEISDVNVRGELPLKEEPWPAFKRVAEQGQPVQELGRLMLNCGFAEKCSKQSKRAYDVVGLILSKGRILLDYAPNGSRAYTSLEGAREFLSDVIAGVSVPMTIESVGDDFRLRHTGNGALEPRVLFGSGALNPSGFICELPGWSSSDALELMQQFVERFASKRFRLSWYASGLEYGGQPPTPERSLQVYATVVGARLPAAKHEVQMQFRLSSLAAIDSVQRLCGPRDQVFTDFCGFDFGDNNATLKIETTSLGHGLLLSLRFSEGLPEVERGIGVAFRSQK